VSVSVGVEDAVEVEVAVFTGVMVRVGVSVLVADAVCPNSTGLGAQAANIHNISRRRQARLTFQFL